MDHGRPIAGEDEGAVPDQPGPDPIGLNDQAKASQRGRALLGCGGVLLDMKQANREARRVKSARADAAWNQAKTQK